MRKPISTIHIFILALGFLLFTSNLHAQQLKLGVNPTFIYPSSVLQLDSKNQGLLLTRVPDTNAINSIIPPDGTIIYFTDSNTVSHVNYGPNSGVYQRKNGAWVPLWGLGYGANGQVLRALGNNVFPIWENLALDSLSNVSISSLTSGQLLQFNGTKWVNWSPPYSSLNGTGYVKMNGTTPTYITAIPNSDLANSTISGIVLGGTLNSLTPSYGLSGSAYNGSAAQTWLADTASSNSLTTKNYVKNRYSGTGLISVNNSTGVISFTGTQNVGTVTSVGLALPSSVFSITGSPVTDSGTLTGSFSSQNQNTVFAAPNSASGVPSFRTLSLLGGDLSDVAISSPAAGQVLSYNGTQWANNSGNGLFWTLTGNSGINQATNFLGTTDNEPIVIKVNNTQAGYIGNNNNFFNTSLGYNSGFGANGEFATAIGAKTVANAQYATALGFNSSVTGNNSTVIGYNATTAQNNTIVLGNGANVGVNTGTPAYQLEVNGTGKFDNALTLGQDLIASGSSGTNGYVLRSLGVGVSPEWENLLLDSLNNVKLTYPVHSGDVLIYNGTNWGNSSGNGTFWTLTGNSGTNSATNFLGTTDAQPLVFKANSSRVGYLGIGGSGGDNNVIFGNGSSISPGGTYAVAIGNATGSQYAVAIGDGAQATAAPSTSIGYFNTASGNSSLALGNNSIAAGSSSVALGSSAKTKSGTPNGVAIGTNANSGNNAAVAIANNASATGAISTAIGYGSTASGNSAFALGYNATASGNYSSALSSTATSTGIQATALGYNAQASATNATALGSNAVAWAANTLILGDTINNIKVGIGLNNPQYNLEVNGTGKFDSPLTLGQDLIASGSSGTNKYVLRSLGAGSSPMWESLALDSLANVSISSPSSGQVLQFNGSSWVNATAGAAGSYWSLTGNTGTTPPTDFLGTTDQQPLVFKVYNQITGYFGIPGGSSGSNIGIGLGTNTGLGYSAVAIGPTASANKQYATSLGYNSQATGYQSLALGGGTSSAQWSIAAGAASSASGYEGTALGYNANASAQSGVALGSGSIASGFQSTAIGNGASATQQNSTAIGNGATANTANTLILGNGANVGIGTSNPSNTLTVNSGTANASGLTLTNLTSASPTTSGAGLIGVDNAGNVVRASASVQRTPSYPNRSFNSSYRISSTLGAFVTYSIQLSVDNDGADVTATLMISPTNSNPWTTVSQIELNSYGIIETQTLSGFIPAGYYVKIVTSGVSADGSISYVRGQEVTVQ